MDALVCTIQITLWRNNNTVYNKVFVWTAVQAHDLKFDQKRSPDD